MLSHLSDDHSVSLCHLIDGLYDKRPCKHRLVVTQRIHILHPLNMGDPFVMVDGIQPGIELSQDDLGVSDDPGIHMDIFIDFRTVNINLENFGIFCKFGGISRHAVAEACSHYDQQICLCDTEI